MADLRLHAQRFFDGQNYYDDHVLIIKDGVIINIDDKLAAVDKYLQGLVVPGYIDLQVNGGGGVLFNQSPFSLFILLF